jgi:hypothetical protein
MGPAQASSHFQSSLELDCKPTNQLALGVESSMCYQDCMPKPAREAPLKGPKKSLI